MDNNNELFKKWFKAEYPDGRYDHIMHNFEQAFNAGASASIELDEIIAQPKGDKQ